MVKSGEVDTAGEHERDSRLLRQLLGTGGDIAAARVDRDLRHTWVHNPNPEPPEADVIGRRDDELFPADDADPTMRLKYEAIETGERVAAEFTFDKPWGERHYEASAEPIYEDGEVVGASFVAFDVTEQHRLEAQTRTLRRQNERLEEFASIVSHDIRNPLNVAQGYIDLTLLDGDVGHLQIVSQALARIETLVEELLVLARQGRDINDPDWVSLAAVAKRAWETTETEDATIEIGDDLVLLADGGRLLGLLENLFRNAVVHGRGHDDGTAGQHAGGDEALERDAVGGRSDPENVPDGTAQPISEPDGGNGGGGGDPVHEETRDIRVRVGPTGDGGGFYVEDDGVGIPVDERERVFEYGVSGTRDGTGYGLAIVENIARAHGWNVAAVEGTDGGARFEVTDVSVAD
jgi:signal transduction histidine kinase